MLGNRAVLLVLGLVVGLIAGVYAANSFGVGGSPGSQQQVLKLQESDRNFMANVANAQISITTQNLAGLIDWCTTNGGIWNTTQEQGSLPVTDEVAKQLQAQNLAVAKSPDGKWIANVALVSRAGCILPIRNS